MSLNTEPKSVSFSYSIEKKCIKISEYYYSLERIIYDLDELEHFLQKEHLINQIDEISFFHLRQELFFIPPFIKKITIHDNFYKHPINFLPIGLTHLIFSDNSEFNQPLDNLPSTLEYLKLGYGYNQPLDNLPSGLVSLTVGDRFNRPIDKLPPKLKNLTLGQYFDCDLKMLPKTLECLKFTHAYSRYGINKIQFNKSLDYLPKSLTELIICGDTDFKLKPFKKCSYLSGRHNI